MNIKQQINTIRSYGTPSIFNGLNFWFVKDGYWYFQDENENHQGPQAVGPFEPTSTVQLYTGHNFQRNLELLNERINTIHKELSYWDLYKITSTVTSEQSFPSIVSALAVGESAVINCDSFDYNQERYHRGDVIVKISDSKEILIKAINTGVFKPVDFQPDATLGGNNYIIKYSYTEDVKPTDPPVELPLQMSEDSTIYGHSFEFTSDSLEETFPSFTLAGQTVKPVIKAFIAISEGLEEIQLNEDLIVAFDDEEDEWTITLDSSVFTPTITTIYVQVK